MKKFDYWIIIILLIDVILYTIACPRIISRTQWDGKPTSVKKQLVQPAFYFIIHQSSSPMCFNQTECSIQMKNIQNFHIHSNGLPDIAYNFCIGQDGNVYEGRGWNIQGGDMSSYNAYAINLCFIGTFENTLPNFKSFLSAQELILCGISKGKVSSAYSLIAHRQLSSFDSKCPGTALFMEIKRNLRFDYNPNQSNHYYF